MRSFQGRVLGIIITLVQTFCILCSEGPWHLVHNIEHARGVDLKFVGPHQQSFSRPVPHTLDPDLVQNYLNSFNVMQDISPEGDNVFTETSGQWVASIPDAYIEGESGLIYDSKGQVYHLPYMFFNRTTALLPLPQRTPSQAKESCVRLRGRVATVIQRYGHMYYHFLAETVPRVTMLLNDLQSNTSIRLLSWGEPYEQEYLSIMGVPKVQLIRYDPSTVYCIDELLLPTPTPRITPPLESLRATRSALHVRNLPSEERNLVIYVSRSGEESRRVSNEAELVAKLRESLPEDTIVVYKGDLTAKETIALFERAKLVIGFHGAGLTHVLFSAPGTVLIELTFLDAPPLMFWHIASALEQEYWLIPVAQSHWMVQEVDVPISEVVDAVVAATSPTKSGACPSGWYNDTLCVPCRAGSYSFNKGSDLCHQCPHGSIAANQNSSYCKICPPGTFSNQETTACMPCAKGTSSILAGAWQVDQCMSPEKRREQLEVQAVDAKTLAKLSPIFARNAERRGLLQGDLRNTTWTWQQICKAQQLSVNAYGSYQLMMMSYATYDINSICSRQSGPIAENEIAKPDKPKNDTAPPILVPSIPIPEDIILGQEAASATLQSPLAPQAEVDLDVEEEITSDATSALPAWAIVLLALLGGLIIFPLTVAVVRHCSLTGKVLGPSLLTSEDMNGHKGLHSSNYTW